MNGSRHPLRAALPAAVRAALIALSLSACAPPPAEHAAAAGLARRVESWLAHASPTGAADWRDVQAVLLAESPPGRSGDPPLRGLDWESDSGERIFGVALGEGPLRLVLAVPAVPAPGWTSPLLPLEEADRARNERHFDGRGVRRVAGPGAAARAALDSLRERWPADAWHRVRIELVLDGGGTEVPVLPAWIEHTGPPAAGLALDAERPVSAGAGWLVATLRSASPSDAAQAEPDSEPAVGTQPGPALRLERLSTVPEGQAQHPPAVHARFAAAHFAASARDETEDRAAFAAALATWTRAGCPLAAAAFSVLPQPDGGWMLLAAAEVPSQMGAPRRRTLRVHDPLLCLAGVLAVLERDRQLQSAGPLSTARWIAQLFAEEDGRLMPDLFTAADEWNLDGTRLAATALLPDGALQVQALYALPHHAAERPRTEGLLTGPPRLAQLLARALARLDARAAPGTPPTSIAVTSVRAPWLADEIGLAARALATAWTAQSGAPPVPAAARRPTVAHGLPGFVACGLPAPPGPERPAFAAPEDDRVTLAELLALRDLIVAWCEAALAEADAQS